ncbi:formylglycine-generating enzyme family protein [uncultured Rhodoblastus sp.]|uniref:formylglycine-generating enzyme family protein n=1 Tax=uncultured Rhodoblastus sp. TaxID=543037 RepID=UPI0025FE200A|nr:formylglycine-generating enzyme family protein [uncultured Rhodoblastus sp.]
MRPGKGWIFGAAALLAASLVAQAIGAEGPAQAHLPVGDYLPFFKFSAGKGQTNSESRPIQVGAFRLDKTPVQNGQFLDFVRAHPEWRRSQAKSLFVDPRYLAKWRGDLAPPEGEAQAPVTNVSWFAAQAFCEARGLRLPTTEEWEYALDDAGRERLAMTQSALDWFSKPNPRRLAGVGRSAPNGYGIYDLVGMVWEWTQDFSSTGSGTEQRNTAGKDDAQFCGGGALGVRDATDYPAFMRYALRASLKAAYTQDNLGFRCAGDE